MTDAQECCRGLAPTQECACERGEIERLRRVEALARELITSGMVQRGDGLVVVESKDKSDPHYRLCVELGL